MTKKQLGTVLRKAREAKGWTWNRTATETGLKADQVKSIERGDKAYTIDSLLVLSKVLGLRLHFSNGSNSSGDVQG